MAFRELTRKSHDAASGLELADAMRQAGRHPTGVDTALAQAQLRHAHASWRRGPSFAANDAWAFRHFNYANLYPCSHRPAAGNLQAASSTCVATNFITGSLVNNDE